MTKYVVDSIGYLRYLVDSLPEAASTIFDRAEGGLDVLYAPDVVIGGTLYEVAFGGEVTGVPLQGNPNDVYRRTVTNGPIDVVALASTRWQSTRASPSSTKQNSTTD